MDPGFSVNHTNHLTLGSRDKLYGFIYIYRMGIILHLHGIAIVKSEGDNSMNNLLEYLHGIIAQFLALKSIYTCWALNRL